MLRRSLFLAAGLLSATLAATPATAQPPASPPGQSGPDCRVRVMAVPTGWIIQGYDPFDNGTPEGTFNVSFTNDGTSECRFAPVFQLDQPPFGLSSGTGKPIRYALLNLTDTQDATPRAGRTQRTLSQPEVALGPNETKTVLYKLIAEPNDVNDAGIFTEDVTIEAQDAQFRSLGGTRLVLGLNVLPSARIGLTGAFTMDKGHAVVDLGDLRPGLAPVPLQLRVSSTGRYEIAVTSANSGRLRLGSTDWYVPYALSIGGNTVNLAATDRLTNPGQSASGNGFRRDSLPIHFVVGDVADKRAGVYSDVLSVAVTAR